MITSGRNSSANKSIHPLQNPLTFVTEQQTRDNTTLTVSLETDIALLCINYVSPLQCIKEFCVESVAVMFLRLVGRYFDIIYVTVERQLCDSHNLCTMLV
jgi:hypothetical protein